MRHAVKKAASKVRAAVVVAKRERLRGRKSANEDTAKRRKNVCKAVKNKFKAGKHRRNTNTLAYADTVEPPYVEPFKWVLEGQLFFFNVRFDFFENKSMLSQKTYGTKSRV